MALGEKIMYYKELPYKVYKDVRRLLEQNQQLVDGKTSHNEWMRDQAWRYEME